MAQLIFVSASQVKELQARYEKLFAQDTAEQGRLMALEERLRGEEQRPHETVAPKDSEAKA
jgi:predicted  nucleic acid-binding Zn-ribbon protein